MASSNQEEGQEINDTVKYSTNCLDTTVEMLKQLNEATIQKNGNIEMLSDNSNTFDNHYRANQNIDFNEMDDESNHLTLDSFLNINENCQESIIKDEPLNNWSDKDNGVVDTKNETAPVVDKLSSITVPNDALIPKLDKFDCDEDNSRTELFHDETTLSDSVTKDENYCDSRQDLSASAPDRENPPIVAPLLVKQAVPNMATNVKTPKARKSSQPTRNDIVVKTVNLMPIVNYKLNIPDIENALRLKQKDLERKRSAPRDSSCEPPAKIISSENERATNSCSPKRLSPDMSPFKIKTSPALSPFNNKSSPIGSRLYFTEKAKRHLYRRKLWKHGILQHLKRRKAIKNGIKTSRIKAVKNLRANSKSSAFARSYSLNFNHSTAVNKNKVLNLTSTCVGQTFNHFDGSKITSSPTLPVSILRATLTAPPRHSNNLSSSTIMNSPGIMEHKFDKDLLRTNINFKTDSFPPTPDSQPALSAEEETLHENLQTVSSVNSSQNIVPLCSCKVVTTTGLSNDTATYCQAVDSVDGKIIGCCNRVTIKQALRPSVRIPFMFMCELHRSRLRSHQCCPGCGQFCSQGQFYQCSRESLKSGVHTFHKNCQTNLNTRYYCPHCGRESAQFQVSLALNDPSVLKPGFMTNSKNDKQIDIKSEKPVQRDRSKTALLRSTYRRDSSYPPTDSVITKFTLSSGKVISSAGLAFGIERYNFEKILVYLHSERSKKSRSLPKNLSIPIKEGDLEKVIHMLMDGSDPNEPFEDYDSCTPLHLAAMAGDLKIVHVLIQSGSDVNQTDSQLKTACMYAAEHNNVDVLAYLIKANACLESKASDGMTCLHIAAMKGNLDCIQVLLQSRLISPNVQDEGGWTPIIWATEHNHVQAVKLLLQYGADANIKDQEENTALHWASYSGSVEIAEMFLNAGSEVESVNNNGERPLHIAARQNSYECVVLYLARGAEVDVVNNNQLNPIDICFDKSNNTCLALKVGKNLRKIAEHKAVQVPKLVHRDISKGREALQIPAVNSVDSSEIPNDYLYVMGNIETSQLHINHVITSLQSCSCDDNCASSLCSCCRSSVTCWYDKEGKLCNELNFSDTPFIFECNRACRCWTTCSNRVVQQGISARIQVFKTKDRGWGARSLLDIAKGSFVCEYIGELISDTDADSREDDSYLFDLDNKDGETYCIDARRYGNVSRFINHLCEPNLVPVKVFIDHQDLRFPRICLFASRDIETGEELGFDYGEKFWMIKWKQFTCTCGSEKCRYSSDVIQKTIAEYKRRSDESDASAHSS